MKNIKIIPVFLVGIFMALAISVSAGLVGPGSGGPATPGALCKVDSDTWALCNSSDTFGDSSNSISAIDVNTLVVNTAFTLSGTVGTGGIDMNGEELTMGDDAKLNFDTAKSYYIDYDTNFTMMKIEGGGNTGLGAAGSLWFPTNAGATGAGNWQPEIYIPTTGSVQITNTLQGSAGEKYLLVDMTDGIRLDTGGYRAIIKADNVATADKTFQFPNASGTLALQDSYYAGMYLDANSNASVMETADIPIMIRNATTGSLQGFTFDAGSTGGITAYSDGTGKVNVASGTHGLVTGDEVSIRGTTNYNGVWTITRIDDDNFSIPDTWVNDNGASDWDEGSHLIAGTSSTGVYALSFNLSCSEGGGAGSNVLGRIYVNSTACTKCVAKRKYANNDYGNLPGTAIISVTAADKLYFTLQSSGVNDITCQYGNLNIHRL